MKKTTGATGAQSPLNTSKAKEPSLVSRRAFFGSASAVAVGAAAVPLLAREGKAQGAEDASGGTRYQETDHVRRYYETNRY